MDQRSGLTLQERLEVEGALEMAFAPLREAASEVTPRYVRAAVRWGRAPLPEPLPWAGAVRRLSELSVAVGMTVMVFATAFGGVQPVLEWPGPDAMRQSQRAAIRQIEATRPPSRVEFAALRDWLDPTVVGSEARARRAQLTAPMAPTHGLSGGPF